MIRVHRFVAAGLAAMTLTLFCALAWTTPALAGSLRCGTNLITRGMRKAEVRDKCGEPTDKDIRIEYRTAGQSTRIYIPQGPPLEGGPIVEGEINRGRAVQVIIEEWTYNLGPNKFQRFLTFENSRLVDIATGTYGY